MAVPHGDLEFFTTVASARTLTEVARHWGVSVSLVSRRLGALEARLGVRLATRGSRTLVLTPEGERYRTHALGILEQIRDLEASVNPDPRDLTGTVRVVSTVGLGRTHIAPLLLDFQRAHPGIAVDLELSSLPLSASLPGFDVAIRVGELADSALATRRLLRNQKVLVAAPEYVEAHGSPADPGDLGRHTCLVVRENDGEATWKLRHGGRELVVPVSGALACNDGLAVIDWCLQGAGIALRSTWHVGEHLASGRLVRVLPEYGDDHQDVMALFDGGPRTPPRVRALVDYLRERLPERVPRSAPGPVAQG